MIFIDSNIPMYLVGSEHFLKTRAVEALNRLINENQKFVTNSEVLQEILHRFSRMKKFSYIQKAMDSLYEIVETVLPVDARDVLLAKDLILTNQRINARDAVHAACMKNNKINMIFSFDSDFDLIDGITRIPKES